MIDINNIVDVDLKIVQGTQEYAVNAYSVCVYLVPRTMYSGDAKLINSEAELGVNKNTLLYQNVKQYFKNNGQKLIICPIESLTLENFKASIVEAKKLASDFIFVVLSTEIEGISSFEGDTDNFIEILNYVEGLKAPNTLRACITVDNINFVNSRGIGKYNVGVKYSNTKSQSDELYDLALLIPAYFSNIILDDNNTVKDYCYTIEKIEIEDGEKTHDGVCNVSQEEYAELIKNCNFIDKIGNNIVNFGGNYANGQSMDTDFGVIALENAICNDLLSAVIGKQYLTENGLTTVKGIIESILSNYVYNGFIQAESTYSGDKYQYVYNNKKYLVIDKGELLEKGYKVFTIPIARISKTDYSARKFTPIIIAMETNRGARTIVIEGLVR